MIPPAMVPESFPNLDLRNSPTDELQKLKQERVSVARVEELFKLVTDNVADLLAIVRPDGTRLWNNKAYEKTLGYKTDALEGTYSMAEVHKEDLPIVQQAFQESLTTGIGRKVEYRMRHKEGHWVQLESQARVVTNDLGSVECLVLVARDISERKRIDEERFKSKKNEAVSSLASGVGHEFKNILENILEHIKEAQDPKEANQNVKNHLELALVSTRQAQQAVARLLNLSMQQDVELLPTNLETLLRDVVTQTLGNTKTKVQISIPESLEPIKADPVSLSNAFQAVLQNAVESMQGAGKITVEITTTSFSLDSATKPPQLFPGNYARIVIQDTGCGISSGAFDRIFEPYFTTKSRQTGLGLTSALSILSRHGGTILVDSKLLVGTTVQLFFPVSQLPAAPVSVPTKPKHSTAKILFMDDEELVRKFVGNLLKQLGYDVTLAKDGKEVIELYGRAIEENWCYHAVIMDLLIPHGVGGAAAVHTLKKMDPSIVAIASSGYVDQPVMQDPTAFGFTAVIAKPYNRERLSEVLKSALA